MQNQNTTKGSPNDPARTKTRKAARIATHRPSGVALAMALVFASASPNTAATAENAGAPTPARQTEKVPELLRGDPLPGDKGFVHRIMVDKVRIDRSHSVDEAREHIRYYAELGFNVLCPRSYYSMGGWSDQDLERIEGVADHAGRSGMFYMQWLRGSFKAGKFGVDSDSRFVGRDGVVNEAVSPSTEVFWKVLEEQILPLARISTREPILGVFFDFEGYGFGGGHWYPPSYDDAAWARFFEERGESVPEVGHEARHGYLEERGSAEKFHKSQYAYWKRKAAALRKKINELNPDFRFAVYPQRWTAFIDKAFWSELSTERAPAIGAEHHTYGRGNPIKGWEKHWRISDNQALRLDHAYLSRHKWRFRSGGHGGHYIGGINTGSRGGADPQLVARKMVLFADHVDGYWIWNSGISPNSRHEREFERWWRVANKAIRRGETEILKDLHEWNPDLSRRWLDHQESTFPP